MIFIKKKQKKKKKTKTKKTRLFFSLLRFYEKKNIYQHVFKEMVTV